MIIYVVLESTGEPDAVITVVGAFDNEAIAALRKGDLENAARLPDFVNYEGKAFPRYSADYWINEVTLEVSK